MSKLLASNAALLESYRSFASQQTFDFEPASLYEPIRYAMASGGKAVRPTLLLLASQLGDTPLSEALPAAYALELFHNFTLLHDDIMDEADLRRGRPAVHKAFDPATAILAGDAMLIHTYGYLLRNFTDPILSKILNTFQSMAEELCGGQQLDMDMEKGKKVDFKGYLTMIHGKTGALITAALIMGGQIAGLEEEQVEKLRRAGDLAGRAFQIQDDLLDTFSTSEKTGKMDYGDIVRAKQSAPYIKAMELGSPQEQQQLAALYKCSSEERASRVDEVLSIYKSLGVENSLSHNVIDLSNEAVELLKSINGNPSATSALVEVTQKLANRAF